jgi:hypothetical protein
MAKSIVWTEGYTAGFKAGYECKESELSNAKSDQALIIKTMIEERRTCIYVIEQDLMDHEEEEKYAADYIMALKDEVGNHEAFIAEYEEILAELNKKEG